VFFSFSALESFEFSTVLKGISGAVGVIEDDDDEHKREDREERKGEAGFYRMR
jgi:hypothetical protein